MKNIYAIEVETIDGKKTTLEQYRGQVLLIVNTASRCGFTPQLKGLQGLYERYRDQGFEILGFPCDQFLHQDPGSNSEIKNFCELSFRTTFPLFTKIEVKGPDMHPLFEHLTESVPGIMGSKKIKWNFTKFLVDRSGRVISRYAPATGPERIAADIERCLSEQS